MQEDYISTFFPHETVRPIQKQMMEDVHSALTKGKHIVIHAPTGIGKTASSLVPALDVAIKKDLTIFFLTSRQTQHHIVIETLKHIKRKKGVTIKVSDVIGKKGMCAQDGVDALYAGEFHEYCKKVREDGSCEFFQNTRKNGQGLTVLAKKNLEEAKLIIPLHVEEMNRHAKGDKLCPYEMAIELGKDARVVIGDYYYLFHEGIRTSFFGKMNKELSKSIIIVDEAHNLPERIRSLATEKLSTFILDRAISEAQKVGKEEIVPALSALRYALEELMGAEEEKLIKKSALLDYLKGIYDPEELMEDLTELGEELAAVAKRSYVLSVGRFLTAWFGEDEGYSRILSKQDKNIQLSYRCLDPSLLTKSVFSACYASVVMSGTLTPTSMYKDVLGVPDAIEKEYPNPFPHNNRLTLVIPKTTTKYAQRTEGQFKDIAVWVAGILDEVPGNCALFFPSYLMRDSVFRYLHDLSERIWYNEKPKFTKEEKKRFIEKFTKEKNAALLGVSMGSFGEGLDMPGVLKGVIVVGLPLTRPDLETNQLIAYYDRRFGKGWDYGYIYPAMTKCLQNAGRCIRSEKDKGVMIFLDERFATHQYLSLFPKEWEMKVDARFKEYLEKFFSAK